MKEDRSKKSHWKVKGNFQEFTESREDFFKVGREVMVSGREKGAISGGDGITAYMFFPVGVCFAVLSVLLSGLVLSKTARHLHKATEKHNSVKNDCN